MTKLVAPTIVVAYGWEMVPQVYAVLMLITALLFWCFTYTDAEHSAGAAHVTVKEPVSYTHLDVYKRQMTWCGESLKRSNSSRL